LILSQADSLLRDYELLWGLSWADPVQDWAQDRLSLLFLWQRPFLKAAESTHIQFLLCSEIYGQTQSIDSQLVKAAWQR
jgi:hypothetical protein